MKKIFREPISLFGESQTEYNSALSHYISLDAVLQRFSERRRIKETTTLPQRRNSVNTLNQRKIFHLSAIYSERGRPKQLMHSPRLKCLLKTCKYIACESRRLSMTRSKTNQCCLSRLRRRFLGESYITRDKILLIARALEGCLSVPQA